MQNNTIKFNMNPEGTFNKIIMYTKGVKDQGGVLESTVESGRWGHPKD